MGSTSSPQNISEHNTPRLNIFFFIWKEFIIIRKSSPGTWHFPSHKRKLCDCGINVVYFWETEEISRFINMYLLFYTFLSHRWKFVIQEFCIYRKNIAMKGKQEVYEGLTRQSVRSDNHVIGVGCEWYSGDTKYGFHSEVPLKIAPSFVNNPKSIYIQKSVA